MANHARVKLPWAVPEDIMDLLARAVMKTVFNGLYEPDPKEGSLGFKRVGSTNLWAEGTMVWSDSSSHVEMRHGCGGLDRVAQSVEFESLCGCFGAGVSHDEGIGAYKIDRPGKLKLLSFRVFCGGLNPLSHTGALGRSGNTSDSAAGEASFMWELSGEDLAQAREKLDPVFFKSPVLDYSGIYTPGPNFDAFQKARGLDVLDWGARLDWAGSVEAAYPGGAGLDAKSAAAALLPSAALGIACSPSALSKAGSAGLERALSVALLWSNAVTAREIHARLAEVSKDPAASETKAKALCDKVLARRGRVQEGREEPNAAESASALFESLLLARSSKKAATPSPVKKNGL